MPADSKYPSTYLNFLLIQQEAVGMTTGACLKVDATFGISNTNIICHSTSMVLLCDLWHHYAHKEGIQLRKSVE